MTTELTYLAWTVALGIAQLMAAGMFFTAANGLPYGASPRDTPPPNRMSVLGGRVERAFKNLLETLPFAVAAILVAHVANRHNGYTILGAQLYFWGRVAYVAIYAAGIPWVRTVAWLVSIAGIILVLLGLVWT